MMPNEFWVVHSDLPREGPGDEQSLDRAWRAAGGQPDWTVCDAACGPGDDIAFLASRAAHVTGFDGHAPFVEAAQRRAAGLGNVTLMRGDLSKIADYAPDGGFDLIWIAGALYFLGVEPGLRLFKQALEPGGVVAFSEPCLFDPSNSDAVAFWGGYPAGTVEDIHASVARAGFETLDSFPLSDAAWEAYYTPMDARIAALRDGADEQLTAMLDQNAQEAADWRRLRAATGYQVVTARVV